MNKKQNRGHNSSACLGDDGLNCSPLASIWLFPGIGDPWGSSALLWLVLSVISSDHSVSDI